VEFVFCQIWHIVREGRSIVMHGLPRQDPAHVVMDAKKIGPPSGVNQGAMVA
jgi:hypothetical protein